MITDRNRQRTFAHRLATPRHDEWLIDEAIADTFPASDPSALDMPGSSVGMRYAAHRRSPPRSSGNLLPWLVAGAALACVVWLARRVGRRRDERS